MNIEFTDRYKATGIPYPDKESCDACEGMGCYPLKSEELNAEACKNKSGSLLIIGQKEKDGSPMKNDDWFFIKCPICNGTRKKNLKGDDEK